MAEKQSFWNILGAILGGVGAVVTAMTGLYLAFKHDPSTAPVAAAAAPTTVGVSADEVESGTMYERTPWLGIELRQNDRPVRLRSINDAWHQFDAKLANGSFEVTVSRRADDPSIGILAWHDDSIFQFVQGGKLHLPGTGIAGAQFAVPILYLNKEGFNYYDSDRMKRVRDDLFSIFISTIGSGELELPLPRFSGPIYLIIFRVPKGRIVGGHDFELVTLRRQ